MPKITVQGLEDYERFLNNLGIEVEEVISEGVHRGAGEIANEVRNQMRAIPTDEKWGTPNNPARGIKKIQKRGLFEGFGISPERNDRGFINVKIGFEDITMQSRALAERSTKCDDSQNVGKRNELFNQISIFKKSSQSIQEAGCGSGAGSH